MIITKKRIRSLAAYAKGIENGELIIACVDVGNVEVEKAIEIGFTPDLEAGESVLPTPVGNITLFNAEGKEVPLKDQPKETHYRQQEWTWKEFRGRYDYEEKSRIVDIPYERYPRQFIVPPAIELHIVTDTAGNKIIAVNAIHFTPENEQNIIHNINIFLEAFGVCEIRNEDLDAIIKSPLKRLNWDVLLQGKKPWGELKPLVSPVINKLSDGNKVVIEKRLESINVHEPKFVAVGRAGFSGYLVFGFPDKNLYILESTKTNNATYVIENNWEHLSGLTKAEILDNNLHRERVIHRESWFDEMYRVLSD